MDRRWDKIHLRNPFCFFLYICSVIPANDEHPINKVIISNDWLFVANIFDATSGRAIERTTQRLARNRENQKRGKEIIKEMKR